VPDSPLIQRKLSEEAFKPRPWSSAALFVTFVGNFGVSVLEATKLPPRWTRLGIFSVVVSLIFLGRVLLARARRDTGPGWIVWALVLGTSGIWTLFLGGCSE
jgi:hypothetical protein